MHWRRQDEYIPLMPMPGVVLGVVGVALLWLGRVLWPSA